MELFQIIIQDEWNNLYEIGFYSDLETALPDINQFLKIYEVEIKPGMLKVSAGTMGPVFDTNLEDLFPEKEEDLAGISIRGFIHDFDKVMKRLESLKPLEATDLNEVDWTLAHRTKELKKGLQGW